MNSPTITMSQDVAIAKLEEYESARRMRPELLTATDHDIMQGYRVIARGGRLTLSERDWARAMEAIQ